MWIFNLDGFFSVVETPDRDYPYRIYAKKEQWASYLSESAENINYKNFKDASLEKASIDRTHKYHSVWSTMAEYGENRILYCNDCGKAISDEEVEISTEDGSCKCSDCRKKEGISAMEKTWKIKTN